MSLTDTLHAIDRRQQSLRGVRFVAAVYKKFSDDGAGQLAALIAYYAFVSIFPLLLVKGSGLALAIGIVGTLLAGMGVTSAAQNAFNGIWDVPHDSRPNFIFTRLRSLAVLAILGTLTVVSTIAAGFVGSSSHGVVAVVAGVLVAFAVNVALFMTAFTLLTATVTTWREYVPGVVVAAILWQLLQHLGGYYVDHSLKHTQALYGTFALVLGLLGWLYLGAQLVIFAAEINVVKARALWPRSFFSAPLTEADKRALTSSAKVEERMEPENVEVRFDEPDDARR